VLAILAILAGVTRVCTSAGRCENISRRQIYQNNRQNHLSRNQKGPGFEHG
jgi:hypothetical protein